MDLLENSSCSGNSSDDGAPVVRDDTGGKPPPPATTATGMALPHFTSAEEFITAANSLLPVAHRINAAYMSSWEDVSPRLRMHVASARLEARLMRLDQVDKPSRRLKRKQNGWGAKLLNDERFQAWRTPGLQTDGSIHGGYLAFSTRRTLGWGCSEY